MRNTTLKTFALITVVTLAAGCSKLGGQSVAAAGKEQWKMVDRFCTDCHNPGDYAGNFDLQKINPSNIGQHAQRLEKVVRKLSGHLMPPPKEPQPDEKTRMAFVSWLENALDEAEAGRHAFPAIAPHRLNRREYANAVHDLLALDVDRLSNRLRLPEVRGDLEPFGMAAPEEVLDLFVASAEAVSGLRHGASLVDARVCGVRTGRTASAPPRDLDAGASL